MCTVHKICTYFLLYKWFFVSRLFAIMGVNFVDIQSDSQGRFQLYVFCIRADFIQLSRLLRTNGYTYYGRNRYLY